KTAKGLTEIATREHRLTPRLRSALIVTDGKRNDAELRALISQQADETLASLLEQGFIEAVAGSAAPAAVAAPAAPAAAAPAADFNSRRRDAVRALTDQIGPMAEALAIRMERARDHAELDPLIVVAAQVLANSRGRQAAIDYAARFGGA
ncbi:MAG: hypothetical protein Q7N95_04365, partial [Alphaproteobacteria bacterium]|nr:hypothetical protein [Alphaproteobacteria bacterium]